MKGSNFNKIERKRFQKIRAEFDEKIGELSPEENSIVRNNIRAGAINGGSTYTDKIERMRQVAYLVTGYRRYVAQAEKEGVSVETLILRHQAAWKRVQGKIHENEKAYEQKAKAKAGARPKEDGGEGAEEGRDAAGDSADTQE